MLFNILLNAGQYTEVAKQGRHINIVLGAGELKLRARSESGQVHETTVIAGMSFEVPENFVNVAIKSTTTQQVKVWLAMYPLNYSPDTSREVGSNAIVSLSGEAYSGVVGLLLPAEVGRNKVTVSPSADILIGGAGLSEKTGIPIPAGGVFEFNTQGSVYAYEATGAYPPVLSTEAGFDDFANPDLIDVHNSQYGIIAANNVNDEYWLFNGTSTIYRHHKSTHAQLGTITGVQGNESRDRRVFDVGDYFEWGRNHAIGAAARWVKIHKTTYAMTVVDIGFSSHMYTAFFNGIRYVFDRVTGYVWSSSDGDVWVQSAAAVPVASAASVKGFDVDSAGNYYAIANGKLYKSTDGGATFSDTTLIHGVDSESGWSQLAINKNDDKIYYCSDSFSHTIAVSADGGATFALIAGFEAGSGGAGVAVWYMHFKGNTLYISGAFKMFQYNEENGLATYDRVGNSQARELHAGDDGRIYWSDNDGLWIVQGEVVKSGGVPIAIMTEVN